MKHRRRKGDPEATIINATLYGQGFKMEQSGEYHPEGSVPWDSRTVFDHATGQRVVMFKRSNSTGKFVRVDSSKKITKKPKGDQRPCEGGPWHNCQMRFQIPVTKMVQRKTVTVRMIQMLGDMWTCPPFKGRYRLDPERQIYVWHD